jgi:SAM-dependent methyltransferase
MKTLNPAVREDLRTGKELRLNLGSGQRLIPGFYNVDHLALPGTDILADLNEPLSELPDNSVAEIYSRHTLEHISRFLELMAELHRVTKPGGRIEIIVPHFSNPYYYSDPTHVRFFGLYTFFYFCDEEDQPRRKVPSFYLPERFKVESVRCKLLKESIWDKVFGLVLQPLINRNLTWLDRYERRFCRWVPANDIRFILRPKKGTKDLSALHSGSAA